MGVHKMNFSTFDCVGSFISWKDYDYPALSKDYMLQRENRRQGRRLYLFILKLWMIIAIYSAPWDDYIYSYLIGTDVTERDLNGYCRIPGKIFQFFYIFLLLTNF